MSTLSDLRSEVITELDIDSKQRINSTTLLNRNINRALRKIQQDTGYSLPECREVYTFVPSTQEENLPADFKHIDSPQGVKRGDSTPLYSVDYTDLLGSVSITASTGGPSSYYVRKEAAQWIFGMYPSPDTSDTITVPYLKKLTEMSADSDESPLDEDFDEAIVQYACYLTIRRKQGFEDKAANYLAFFTETVDAVDVNRQTADIHSLQMGHRMKPFYGSRRYNWGPRQTGN